MPAVPTARGSSPPLQINRSNVSKLEVAWTYPGGQTDFNPLVVRGVVYGRGPNGSFVALDAATGQADLDQQRIAGFNVRGDELLGEQGRQGPPADLQHRQHAPGARRADRRVDPLVRQRRPGRSARRPRSRSGDDQSAVAHAGSSLREPADHGVRDQPGIRRPRRATSAHSTFVPARSSGHSIPCRGPANSATTPGRTDAWKTVGGANNWGEQSIDAKRGIVYVPTGSPKYNFYGGNRKGANLFGDCLIALDARTGKRLWHFQTVHHDIWDLDNNSAPQLTTIRQDGRSIDVVALASKTGYLYVFDRVTGKPIWPIEERPVPQKSTVPGRGALADAAVPDRAAAVLAAEVHGRRRESVHPDARGTRAVQAADSQGAGTTARSRRSDSRK